MLNMKKKVTEQYDYGEIEDIVLIHAYTRGDEKAFETLYYRYRQQLYGYLNNLTGGSCEADEVFSETWQKVIRKLPGYRDDGKFSAWLFRIARNVFIDRIRHNKPDKFVDADAEDWVEPEGFDTYSPERELGRTDISEAINAALESLQPEQKEVFLLREEAQLSFKEIAKIQGCSLGTALSRMRYALKRLRSFLENIDAGGLLK